MDKTRKTVRSILSPHGLEQLIGSDIAATAIPAAAAVNVNLLDAAAGYILANPGGPLYISQGAVFDRATGQWNAEAGVTAATMIQLNGGVVYFYNWSGAAGAANITWTEAQTLRLAGGAFGQAQPASPGYIRLGAITMLWGQDFITTGTPPGESVSSVGYPIGVTSTLHVTVTLVTNDESVVWLSAAGYGATGFELVCYRNNLAGEPGPLNVSYSWFAVAQT